MTSRLAKFSAWLALIIPLWFALLVAVIGGMQPDYSHRDQYISELGASGAPYAAWINYPGILVFGLTLVAFAPALYQWARPGIAGWLTAGLLWMTGMGFVLLGLYPCDAGCSLENLSDTAQIHNQAAILTFSLAIAVTGILGTRCLTGRRPRALYIFSLLASAILAAVFAWMLGSGYQTPWSGFRQRVFLGLFSIWLMWLAWTVLQAGRQALTREY